MRGSPRIASDHRPATNGVVSAKTPSAINRAPAMRFLITPELDGIGIYPCSINAHFEKPLLKRPAGQSASRARRGADLRGLVHWWCAIWRMSSVEALIFIALVVVAVAGRKVFRRPINLIEVAYKPLRRIPTGGRKAAYRSIVEVRPSNGNFANDDPSARIVERDRAAAVGRQAADELPGVVIDRARLRRRLARQNSERQECQQEGALSPIGSRTAV
jgi:hypothetical protein